MMHEELGKWLMGIGLLILFGGVIVWLFGNHLGWLGNLPGDIKVERENFGFYFPVTTMIIISIVLSILFTFLLRFFK